MTLLAHLLGTLVHHARGVQGMSHLATLYFTAGVYIARKTGHDEPPCAAVYWGSNDV